MSSKGADLIAAERRRQVDVEGWTPEHDDEHRGEEMAMAAACYAAPEPIYAHETYVMQHRFVDPWPWAHKWDGRGKHDRIRQLVIAGALCAAEIDRLLREQERGHE